MRKYLRMQDVKCDSGTDCLFALDIELIEALRKSSETAVLAAYYHPEIPIYRVLLLHILEGRVAVFLNAAIMVSSPGQFMTLGLSRMCDGTQSLAVALPSVVKSGTSLRTHGFWYTPPLSKVFNLWY